MYVWSHCPQLLTLDHVLDRFPALYSSHLAFASVSRVRYSALLTPSSHIPTLQADTYPSNITCPEAAHSGVKRGFCTLLSDNSTHCHVFIFPLTARWLTAKFNSHMDEPFSLKFPDRTIPCLFTSDFLSEKPTMPAVTVLSENSQCI